MGFFKSCEILSKKFHLYSYQAKNLDIIHYKNKKTYVSSSSASSSIASSIASFITSSFISIISDCFSNSCSIL